jgi:DNA-binding NarL/FixJ family response regulator
MSKNTSHLNILLVDDHTLFRRGAKLLIGQFKEVDEVMEAEGGKEALELLAKQPFDIVLLDLEMPIMDGRQTAKKIIQHYPEVKIVMLSSHDTLEIISEMIEIGIHSYLVKDAQPEEVHQAILSVVNNDFYYNQLVSKALRKTIESNGSLNSTKVSDLSPREIEILQLICQELTMKEIGEALFLSEQTIHTHRKNLMKKTNAKNAVGLVKYAFQKGIASF